MNEMIKIRYKSIIIHESNEKITDQFEIDAKHRFVLNEESYAFDHAAYGKMEIVIKGNQVVLSHGSTKLPMLYNEKQKVLYNTMYGQIPLEVYLKKLHRTNDSLNIVYYLYDGSTILSKCYLVLEKINPMLS